MLRLLSSRPEFWNDFTTKFTTRLSCAHRLKFYDIFTTDVRRAYSYIYFVHSAPD